MLSNKITYEFQALLTMFGAALLPETTRYGEQNFGGLNRKMEKSNAKVMQKVRLDRCR